MIENPYYIANGAKFENNSKFAAWQCSQNRSPEGPILLNSSKRVSNRTSRYPNNAISTGGEDLLPRGTGLKTGRAGERRRGILRTEEERRKRHFGDSGVVNGGRNAAGLYQIYTTLGYKRGIINPYYSPNGPADRAFRSGSPILQESVTTDNSMIHSHYGTGIIKKSRWL